jgi:hypothetical protein
VWEEGCESLSRTGEEKTYAQADVDFGPGGDAGALGRCGGVRGRLADLLQCCALLRDGQQRQIYERQCSGLYDRIISKGGHDLLLANSYTNDTDIVKGALATTRSKSTTGTAWTGPVGAREATGAS